MSEPASMTIAQHLETEGRPSIEQAVRLTRKVASAVEILHAGGSLHFAIGPAAVFVDAGDSVRLGDPASGITVGRGVVDADSVPLALLDTSPIQLRNAIADASRILGERGIDIDPRRIDVHQLGVLLCELVLGITASDYLRKPPGDSEALSGARAIIDRALGLGDRPYVRCQEMIEDLDALLESGTLIGADDPLPFTRLGAYEVSARLGRGGMGEVFLGRDPALERPVAIKVLSHTLVQEHGERYVHRFQSEARAVASLRHPNIVQVYASGEQDGHYYFAMEYVQGETLAQLLKREGRLPVNQALSIIRQVLLGLAEAHRHGLVHRDIKPGNILLEDRTGRALIADFGIVKASDRDDERSAQELTLTGVVMGTAEYLAPEQALGEPVDGRADLYAVGVMMYRLLSGELPFKADTAAAMTYRHTRDQAPSLRANAPDVPARLCRVVDQLLAKSPDQRFESAEQALAAIDPEDEPPVATRRRWLAVAVICVIVAALFAGLGPMLGFGSHHASLLDRNPGSVYEPAVETRLTQHTGNVIDVAMSDSGIAVSVGKDQTLCVWDLAKGTLIKQLTGHTNTIFNLCLSRNGKRAVSAAEDETLRVWDIDAGTSRVLPIPASDAPGRIALSSDGRILVVGGTREMWVYDLDADRVVIHRDSSAYSVAIDVTGQRYAYSGWEKEVYPVEIGSSESHVALVGHTKHVYALACSDDGRYIAAGEAGGVLSVWDTDSGTRIQTIQAHDGDIRRVGLSGDGSRVLSYAENAKVWDVATGRLLATIEDVSGLPAMSADGQLLAAPTGRQVVLWRLPDLVK